MATKIDNSGVTFPDGSVQPTATGTRQYLTTLTASNSASLQYTGHSNTYRHYDYVFDNIICTSGYWFTYRYYVGGVYQTTGYYTAGWVNSNANGWAAQGGYTAQIVIDSYTYNVAGGGVSGIMTLFNCRQTTNVKYSLFRAAGTYYTAGYSAGFAGCGTYTGSNAAVDGIQFLPTGGSIISGSIDVYGWN